MLSELREIVEKVASAPCLSKALNLLVKEICIAMKTEVCSVYLADNDRHCYYLMATRGLKKPRGYTVTLAFDEGIVGLVGRLAEPINLADAQRHPSFKYIPDVKEEKYSAFLGAPIISRRQLLGVLVIQQREHRQFNKNEESFLVTLAMQIAALLSHSHISQLFGQLRHTRVKAIAASPGIAVAMGWVDQIQSLLNQVSAASTLDIQQERDRLILAMDETENEFRRFSKRFAIGIQKESVAIFDLYSHLLTDVRLKKDLFAAIDNGYIAEWAVKTVIEKFIKQVNSLQNDYLRERAGDLRILGERILFHLNHGMVRSNSWPERFILVVDELTATMLAEIPHERLVGIVVRDGAANSHAAILTRAMGIPAVMGADIYPLHLNKRLLIVDGYSGIILIDPEPLLIQEYQKMIREENVLSEIAENFAKEPGKLRSGQRIKIMLNAGLAPEYEQINDKWVDGIGLYRTEIPFMLQNGFPSEEEQVLQYQAMLRLFCDKPVTLRTLDIGSDKQLPYMPISEENPCLGWRGIRLTLDQPEIFLIQIRAMLRANLTSGNLRILLPMISHIDEVEDACGIIDRASREVEDMLGYQILKPHIGVMIEVPSMLFMISDLANKVHFITVGTNDLIQYLLAVDRNNKRVANLYDPLHPAVLRTLKIIADESRKHKLDLCLCGEMAGDPMCVIILVGLGYYRLSMNAKNIPRIKYLLRHLDLNKTQRLSKHGIEAHTASEVRCLISMFMKKYGLGLLIH